MIKSTTKSNNKRRSGVAAVEAAVCLPLLVLIFFGALEVSGGIFQEYDAQAAAYELSKAALESQSSCEDVRFVADQILPQLGYSNYSISIDVLPRTVNADSVEPTTATSFSILPTGTAPVGLEDLPRGTLLKLSLTVDRPGIAGIGLSRVYMGGTIESDCVFVKEF